MKTVIEQLLDTLRAATERARRGFCDYDALARAVAEAEAMLATPELGNCDGNHGGPRCADPECWNDSPDPSIDVRTILLDIVPGDGSGLEVFAKSVDDVVAKLTELAEREESLSTQADLLTAAVEARGREIAKLKGTPEPVPHDDAWKAEALGKMDRIEGLLQTFLRSAVQAGITHLPATFAADQPATPEPVAEYFNEPGVIYAGVRDAEEELHIECRFDDGQKFAAVTVAKGFGNLARRIEAMLNDTRPAAAPAVPEIDYTALIRAAFATNKKWAQGTNGCVAFARGAAWFRDQIAAAQAKGGE